MYLLFLFRTLLLFLLFVAHFYIIIIIIIRFISLFQCIKKIEAEINSSSGSKWLPNANNRLKENIYINIHTVFISFYNNDIYTLWIYIHGSKRNRLCMYPSHRTSRTQYVHRHNIIMFYVKAKPNALRGVCLCIIWSFVYFIRIIVINSMWKHCVVTCARCSMNWIYAFSLSILTNSLPVRFQWI